VGLLQQLRQRLEERAQARGPEQEPGDKLLILK